MLRTTTGRARLPTWTPVKFLYVYQLVSETAPDRHYTGVTEDLEARLAAHNRGEVPHTRKFRPREQLLGLVFVRRPNQSCQFKDRT